MKLQCYVFADRVSTFAHPYSFPPVCVISSANGQVFTYKYDNYGILISTPVTIGSLSYSCNRDASE